MALFQDIGGHRRAHDPQANETDGGHFATAASQAQFVRCASRIDVLSPYRDGDSPALCLPKTGI
jgi:hypothetical protein